MYRLKDDPYSSHSLILRRLGRGEGRRVLDVGAADGILAERLTQRGWLVTAIARDSQLAARARGRCRDVVVADLERGLPPVGGPFEAAVCGDVLEHLSDPLRVLRGLGRVLMPGAVVIACVPNVAHVWVRLSLLLGRFEYSDRGILDRAHLRFFTQRSFVELLNGAGLVVDQLLTTPAPLPLMVPERLRGRWLRPVHAAGAAAARCWMGGLAYQFVAICAPAVSEPVEQPQGWRSPAAALQA